MPRRTVGESLVFHLFGARWVRVICVSIFKALFGLDIRGAEFVPRGKPVIFVGNHGSHYDGLFSMVIVYRVLGTLPVPVAWSGILDIPVAAQFISSGAVPVISADDFQPETTGARAGVLDEMVEVLRSGRNLVVHAEGRRNAELGIFQPGAAFAAVESGAALVPFTLRGVQGLWNELPLPNRWHGRVSVQFHRPVEPADYATLPARKAIEAITAEVRRRVASALDYPDGRAA